MKSFVPKAGGKPPSSGGGGRNAERNFRGEKRTNDTHSSTTDADARLSRWTRRREDRIAGVPGPPSHLLGRCCRGFVPVPQIGS